MKRILCASAISLAVFSLLMAQTASRRSAGAGVPSGYWRLEKSQAIIEKTQTVRLAPDFSHLTAGERAVIGKLLKVGNVF